MKERRLTMTPEFLGLMFSGTGGWRITKNRLPEDAKVVRAEVRGDAFAGHQYLDLWVTSAAFREDDPVDLPDVWYDRIETK